MPMGWAEVTIGGEPVIVYVQDTAGPVEIHAPAGTKAAPGTPVRIGERRYVVRGSRDPGDRGEVAVIELMTEADAKAAREASRSFPTSRIAKDDRLMAGELQDIRASGSDPDSKAKAAPRSRGKKRTAS